MAQTPRSINLLINYLNQSPHPTEVNIAILHPDSNDAYPELAYAKVEEHLGINAPDLPKLARDFRHEYALLRQQCFRQSDADDAGRDGIMMDDVTSLRSRILDTTTCLLLVCPDHSTAWADRRRALSGANKSMEEYVLQKEMRFCNLLFTQHSKAPSSWAHRKWIGRKIVDMINECGLGAEDCANKVKAWSTAEIDICSMVAEKYAKNYHAWTHRRWVCQYLFNMFHDANNADDMKECDRMPINSIVLGILQNELSTSQRWMKTHVTDHSAVHYQGQILAMLLEVGMCPNLNCEINLNHLSQKDAASTWGWNILSEALKVARSSSFKSYEVTWIYRRICGLACVNFISNRQNDDVGGQSNNKDTALEEFIKVELIDLASANLANDHGCPKSRRYALAYIVWMLHQIKSTKLWSLCPTDDLISVCIRVTQALASDEAIVGNAWRKMNDQILN